MTPKREPMLDIYIYEAQQMLEKLEQCILSMEAENEIEASIGEIFRIMHTLKGNSGMMLFNNIAELAHKLEDLFDYIRKNNPPTLDKSAVADLVLSCSDFIKNEIEKIDGNLPPDGDPRPYMETAHEVLLAITEGKAYVPSAPPGAKGKFYIASETPEVLHKQRYRIWIKFQEGCEMENIRAFSVAHGIEDFSENMAMIPRALVEDPGASEYIRKNGFLMSFDSGESEDRIGARIAEAIFVETYELKLLEPGMEDDVLESPKNTEPIVIRLEDEVPECETVEAEDKAPTGKSFMEVGSSKESAGGETNAVKMVSVDVEKLDRLMDMVGELVISEAMVTRNPELEGLTLDSFHKASRQLRKITDDLQDIAMSMRMVSVSTVFQKMKRLVRDMAKKTNKEILLELIGEDTEADKNIIEQIADPLMHLIRNAADHGIEEPGERKKAGKSNQGHISLEARNVGSEVWIIIKDDGKGLDRNAIYRKAFDNGLTSKPEGEISEKEIFSYIFLPGFSTKENVTEFSGRGVGMDVVSKNIEKIRGNIQVESTRGLGTTFTIRIPLTLSIVDGMTIRVGYNRYTMPITSIKESFRLSSESIIEDLEGNMLVMVRGETYPVLRLAELFRVSSAIEKLEEGIMIMIEDDGNSKVLFADELLGEQQVVVKTLPRYIKKVRGIAGCTILGDGGISLILDIPTLINK